MKICSWTTISLQYVWHRPLLHVSYLPIQVLKTSLSFLGYFWSQTLAKRPRGWTIMFPLLYISFFCFMLFSASNECLFAYLAMIFLRFETEIFFMYIFSHFKKESKPVFQERKPSERKWVLMQKESKSVFRTRTTLTWSKIWFKKAAKLVQVIYIQKIYILYSIYFFSKFINSEKATKIWRTRIDVYYVIKVIIINWVFVNCLRSFQNWYFVSKIVRKIIQVIKNNFWKLKAEDREFLNKILVNRIIYSNNEI